MDERKLLRTSSCITPPEFQVHGGIQSVGMQRLCSPPIRKLSELLWFRHIGHRRSASMRRFRLCQKAISESSFHVGSHEGSYVPSWYHQVVSARLFEAKNSTLC